MPRPERAGSPRSPSPRPERAGSPRSPSPRSPRPRARGSRPSAPAAPDPAASSPGAAPSAPGRPTAPSPTKGSGATPPATAADPTARKRRAELDERIQPFIAPDTDLVVAGQGDLGPSPETILVVTFRGEGRGVFFGFALVPDRKAQRGMRELALPELPAGSASGEMRIAALTSIDRDPALEAIVAFEVIHGAESEEHGGHTYDATELVVLDWDAARARFVRLPAIEKRLAASFPAGASPPGPAEIRGALGLQP
jgi:hypothetical protein